MFWDKHGNRVPGKMADDNSKKSQAVIGHAMANLAQKNLSESVYFQMISVFLDVRLKDNAFHLSSQGWPRFVKSKTVNQTMQGQTQRMETMSPPDESEANQTCNQSVNQWKKVLSVGSMKTVRPKSDAQAAKQIYSHPAIFATKHLCFSSCLFRTNSQNNKPGPQTWQCSIRLRILWQSKRYEKSQCLRIQWYMIYK